MRTGFGAENCEKRPLFDTFCGWENNIKMDLKNVGREGVNWIDVAEGKDKKKDMNLRFAQNARNLLTSWVTKLFEDCSMELIISGRVVRRQHNTRIVALSKRELNP